MGAAGAAIGTIGSAALGARVGRKTAKRAEEAQERSIAAQRGLIEQTGAANLAAQQEARKAAATRSQNLMERTKQAQSRGNILGTPAGEAGLEELQRQQVRSGDILASELSEQESELARQRNMALAGLEGRAGDVRAERASRDPRSQAFQAATGFFAGEFAKDKPFGFLSKLKGQPLQTETGELTPRGERRSEQDRFLARRRASRE